MEMDTSVVLASKRDHVCDLQGQDEASKKRKTELDAEEGKQITEGGSGKANQWWLDDFHFEEEELTDPLAFLAADYREFWERLFHHPGRGGSFEDETAICAKRFTDERPPDGGHHCSTLQIFSLKVVGLRGDLQFPLDVYGMVAVRDSVDHNRNVIFRRQRDNCQTLTAEHISLKLTGPKRPVFVFDPATFEVDLKVKGTTEFEDKRLSFMVPGFRDNLGCGSYVIKRDYTSKLSTIEFTLGLISISVEATISVKIIGGSWRDDVRGKLFARTASIANEEVVLLDFGDDKVSLDGDSISLSRSVVTVDHDGQLIVCVETLQGDQAEVKADSAVFTPLELGTSCEVINAGFCRMEVTVAWSLFNF